MRTLTAPFLAVLAATMMTSSPAHAEPPASCVNSTILVGVCQVSAGSGGSGGGGSAAPASTGAMCSFNGAAIPCSQNGGWWSASYGCYISGPFTADALGLPTSLLPEEWFKCTPPGSTSFTPISIAPGAPPLQVDPEVLARQAIEQMNLRAIDIGIVPEPGPASMGLVGLPVWMWVDEPGPATWGPLTTTATAGATTVTATARVSTVDWDMGDGTVITCTGRGTPYEDGYGDSPSPDCGHEYMQTSAARPGQAYAVTATSNWVVEWSGGGASGAIPLSVATATPLRIGEVQVLIN